MRQPELVEPFKTAALKYLEWWDRDVTTAEEAERALAQPLTHYTNARGLNGLFSNEEIWLTSLFHLNDPTELAYGRDIAKRELEIQTANGSKLASHMASMARQILDDHLTEMFTFFVASFSANRDELGQWRAYGDDGKGYAVGIASEVLWPSGKTDVNSIKQKPILAQVIYDEAVAVQRQRVAITQAIAALDSCAGDSRIHSKEFGLPFLQEITKDLVLAILLNSVTTKHSAYAAEQEMRLILARGAKDGPDSFKTRVRGSSFVPYVPLPLPIRKKGNLVHLVVGPSAGPEAMDGARHFLRTMGIESDGLLVKSLIPYRGRA